MKKFQFKIHNSNILVYLLASVIFVATSCSSGSGEKAETSATTKTATETVKSEEAPETGVGPVKTVQLSDEIDQAMVSEGLSIFESKCSACHQIDERYVGPAIKGVTQRRNPVWIMNMVINPVEMTQKDPVAKKLLAEYLTQMVNQNITESDARALLEYFRSIDKEL